MIFKRVPVFVVYNFRRPYFIGGIVSAMNSLAANYVRRLALLVVILVTFFIAYKMGGFTVFVYVLNLNESVTWFYVCIIFGLIVFVPSL